MRSDIDLYDPRVVLSPPLNNGVTCANLKHSGNVAWLTHEQKRVSKNGATIRRFSNNLIIDFTVHYSQVLGHWIFG